MSTLAIRTALRLAAVLSIAPLAVFATSEAASALPANCTGSQIASKPIQVNEKGASYGTLYLYYDSSKKKNCAKAVNGVGGATQWMTVYISRCKAGTGARPGTCDLTDGEVQGVNYDSGPFTQYAGAVYTSGQSAGVCVWTHATLATSTIFADATIGGHCD